MRSYLNRIVCLLLGHRMVPFNAWPNRINLCSRCGKKEKL